MFLTKRCCSIFAVIGGTILVIVVGIVGWIVVPAIIDDHVKDSARLTNRDTRQQWKFVRVPIQMKFYIFNITNPDALENNEKLNFEEHGPYVYNVRRIKKNARISEDKVIATYKETSSYYFDRRESKGSEDDIFNVPNIPLIALAHTAYATKIDHELEEAQILMAFLLGKEGIIKRNVTVKEILFQGWDLPDILNEIPEESKPRAIKGGKFGLYRLKNGSNDGEYVVLTGDKNHEEFGRIVSWKGKKELDWWYTKGLDINSSDHFCNKINGSDGAIFPPFVTKETILRMFTPTMCRSLWLKYHSETTYHDIPAYRFKFPVEMFTGPSCNRNNKCFCPKQSQKLNHHCWSATTRLFTCLEGAPIVTSWPHFLYADEEVFEAVELTKPCIQKHESYMDIEPLSGSVLSASMRLQLNIELQNIPGMSDFGNLNFTNYTESSSILLPILWVEQAAHLDRFHTKELRQTLVVVVRDINLGKWFLLAVGGLCISTGSVYLISMSRRTEY